MQAVLEAPVTLTDLVTFAMLWLSFLTGVRN